MVETFRQIEGVDIQCQDIEYFIWEPASHGVIVNTHSFVLPSGKVAVSKANPIFAAWLGAPLDDTYNGKAILSWHGRPAFAELAILWSMMEGGWDGVWIDTYRRKFRRGYWDSEPVALPKV